MLHRRAELPVAGTNSPASADGLVVSRRRALPAEVLIVPRPAFAVDRGVQQIALRDVITVRIDPSPGDAGDEPARRIDRGIAAAVGRGPQVFAHVHLERCPAVPEHVVGESRPRRHVVVTRHPLCLGHDDRVRNEHIAIDLLLGKKAPGAIEPHRPLQREPAVGPLFLPVERVGTSARARRPGTGRLRDLVGNGVVEPVCQTLIVVLDRGGLEIVLVARALVPELEIVGARHVRRRGIPRVRAKSSARPIR